MGKKSRTGKAYVTKITGMEGIRDFHEAKEISVLAPWLLY
jgi:hypothetical protein